MQCSAKVHFATLFTLWNANEYRVLGCRRRLFYLWQISHSTYCTYNIVSDGPSVTFTTHVRLSLALRTVPLHLTLFAFHNCSAHLKCNYQVLGCKAVIGEERDDMWHLSLSKLETFCFELQAGCKPCILFALSLEVGKTWTYPSIVFDN